MPQLEMHNIVCNDYVAGETMGRSMAICKYYIENGSCKRPNHFMCEFFLRNKKQTRGGLAVKCYLDNKWRLREDCKDCKEKKEYC